jgi:hypothetical protein
MSQDVRLRIGEVRIEAPGDTADPEAVRRALETALAELARTLQARLAGRGDVPVPLELHDITVREPEAKRFLAAGDFQRLTDALLAEIEARIGGAR